MKLSGTIVFFVDWRGEKKDVLNAHATIGRKWKAEDGSETQINRGIDINFGSTNFKPEQLAKLKENTSYTMEVEDGWLSLDRYHKKGETEWTYKIVLHIAKARITKATPIDPAKREKALAEARAKRQAEQAGDQSPLDLEGQDLPF